MTPVSYKPLSRSRTFPPHQGVFPCPLSGGAISTLEGNPCCHLRHKPTWPVFGLRRNEGRQYGGPCVRPLASKALVLLPVPGVVPLGGWVAPHFMNTPHRLPGSRGRQLVPIPVWGCKALFWVGSHFLGSNKHPGGNCCFVG